MAKLKTLEEEKTAKEKQQQSAASLSQRSGGTKSAATLFIPIKWLRPPHRV